MPDSLPELLDSRSHPLQELLQLGDFQPAGFHFLRHPTLS